MKVCRYVLPRDPESRVRWTMQEMGRLAVAGLHDPKVVMTARSVALSSGRPRDHRAQATALLDFVRDRVRYVNDPLDVEVLATPRQVLEQRCGDCDEQACLLACMAMAVGIPARIVAAKPSPHDPEWRHVWPELAINGRWTSADAATPNAPLGWQVRPAFSRLALPLVTSATGQAGIFDTLRDIVTLKPLRRALEWTWRHMPSEIRKLAITIGPIVAGMYFPGFGKPLAQAAVTLLEGDRVARRERIQAKEAIAQAKAQGLLPADFDPKNPDHLEALRLAGEMSPEDRAAWVRGRTPGGAPASGGKAAAFAAAALVAASVLT